MRVEFFKSDAMAERFPDEPTTLVLDFPQNVQLTYTDLRTTRNWPEMGYQEGDTVAFNLAGDWIIAKSPLGRSLIPVTSWSDVIIGGETE